MMRNISCPELSETVFIVKSAAAATSPFLINHGHGFLGQEYDVYHSPCFQSGRDGADKQIGITTPSRQFSAFEWGFAENVEQ